jgi:hypothetical protein
MRTLHVAANINAMIAGLTAIDIGGIRRVMIQSLECDAAPLSDHRRVWCARTTIRTENASITRIRRVIGGTGSARVSKSMCMT